MMRQRVPVADEENEKIRFLDPNPRLAMILREQGPIILPKKVWKWSVDWVQDIGTIIRSRDYWAYVGAQVVTGTLAKSLGAIGGLR